MLCTVVVNPGEGYQVGPAEARKTGEYLGESARIAHYRERKTRNPSKAGGTKSETGVRPSLSRGPAADRVMMV